MTRAEKTLQALQLEGWTIDHTACHTGYTAAGAVRPMRPENGLERCRVFTSRTVGRDYQLTYVLTRPVQKEA